MTQVPIQKILALRSRIIHSTRDELKDYITKHNLKIRKNLSAINMREQILDEITRRTKIAMDRRLKQVQQQAQRKYQPPEDVDIQLANTPDLEEIAAKMGNRLVGELMWFDPSADASSMNRMRTNMLTKMPFYGRAIKYDDGKSKILTRYIKVFTAPQLDSFIEHVLDKQQGYDDDEGDILFELVPPKDAQKLPRMAKLSMENCVLNIVRGFVGDNKVANFYRKYPSLHPDNATDGGDGHKYIYVGEEDLKSIAKELRVRFVVYSHLGAILNKPWKEIGYKNDKIVPIQVSRQHATMVSMKLKASAVEYHPESHFGDKMDDLNSTRTIDMVFDTNARDGTTSLIYYTELEYCAAKKQKIAVLHKSFRPSTITHNELDDTNPAYHYVFNKFQMLSRIFMEEYGLAPITNPNMQKIIASSELFIGRRRLTNITNIKDFTLIDHNKNYVAYEKSPYYQGFPTGPFYPVRPECSLNPAFYVCKNIHNPPKAFTTFYGYTSGPIVIPAPTYKYMVSMGSTIDVDLIIDSGTTKNISIVDFADKLDIAPEDKKLFRNQLVGRLISGGIANERKRIFVWSTIEERDQLFHECQTNDIPFSQFGSSQSIEASIKRKSNKCLYHIHSYILSYASIFMMSKFHELEDLGYPICAFNVDALAVKANLDDFKAANHQMLSDDIGGWKVEEAKKHWQKFNDAPLTYKFSSDHAASIMKSLPTREVTIANEVITGAAGIAKSWPWLTDPMYDQIILTPTRALAEKHRQYFPNSTTAHKYFQFSVNTNVWNQLRREHLIPREHQVIVIDEGLMFTKSQWDIIRQRAGNSIIKVLTDPEQIACAIGSEPANLKYFTGNGFKHTEITRSPDKICRHNYYFGQELDGLRGLPFQQQIDYILERYPTMIGANMADNLPVVDESFTNDNPRHVIVGDHESAKVYNDMLRNACRQSTALYPFRLVSGKKAGEIHWLPVDTKNVYWDRTKMSDKEPKGTKYEPAFAVTSDSFQGQTVNYKLAVDIYSLNRHGTLYTAMTRVAEKNNLVILI